MASNKTTKKNTGTKKKTTTARKSSSSAGSHKSTTQKKRVSTAQMQNVSVTNSIVSNEVILWSTLAVSILLFLGDLGFGGIIGDNVGRFFFGLFGVLSYGFPFLLLFSVFFMVSNRQNQIAVIKVVSVVCLFLFLITLVDLVTREGMVVLPTTAYVYGFQYKNGGGFFGGGLAYLLVNGFGLLGAYVIDIIGMIISVVLITETSIFRAVKNRSHHEKVRADMRRREKDKRRAMRREEIQKEKEAEQEKLKNRAASKEKKNRIELKNQGVTFETKLEDNKTSATEDVTELNINIYNPAAEVEDINRVSLTSGASSKTELIREPAPQQEVPEVVQKPEMKSEPMPVEEQSEPAAVATRPRDTVASRQETAKETEKIEQEVLRSKSSSKKKYRFPTVDLLTKNVATSSGDSREKIKQIADNLEKTLEVFGVPGAVENVSVGPSVTRFEFKPELGVKVSKITNLADDIKLNLAAKDIRIEAPIPGKQAVGIEIPNENAVMVGLRELIEAKEFKKSASKIAFAAGRDIGGNVIISDIAKMPHLLIAGSTGSGKSVCINTIIMSILYRATPEEVKLIMIDPKVVELSVYNGIPHLLIPVVTDPKKAAGALQWAVKEMTDRYQRFADAGVRDMKGYNAKVDANGIPAKELPDGSTQVPQKMAQIVVIVDELADLMMVSSKEVEEAICRLAQLARAAGIHLIVATQRPSVNVITGLIKANMPSRIAFAVTSGVDSRTILDQNGAEKLLGKGDMLYFPQGFTKPLRVQGTFVSDEEVASVVKFIREQNETPEEDAKAQQDILSHVESFSSGSDSSSFDASSGGDDERDSYFADAGRLIIEKEKGSIGMLQRNFKIGFNRAARIMDQLQDAGVVGPEEGTKPRKVLVTLEEFNGMVS